MVEETKEIENSESPAVRLVRLSYIERIGSLLSIMIGEDISPRKSIVKEFHVSYDTIRKFINFDSKIKFDTIAKFCHITDRDERLALIKNLKRQYEEIFGAGAEVVKDLNKKKIDLRKFVTQGIK